LADFIKIIIADSQYLVRKGLTHLISKTKGLKLIAESSTSKALIESTNRLKPDVIMMDYHQQENLDLKDIKSIKKHSPKTNIMVLSADNNRENISQALSFGANSFLTKQCSKEEITNAIYACAKGEKFFCNKVLNILIENNFSLNGDDCKPTELSIREIQIVKLIAQGLSSKMIAEELHLSPHTIYTHRKNVMKKLHFKSSSELVLYAVNTGIINTN